MSPRSAPPWDPEAVPTFWINHASRLLMRHFEQRLRPLEFGMAYLPVAIALEEQGPLLQKQLAEYAHVEQPTMAALLTRMERDGLIQREPHPDDKRATRISLSAKGRGRLPQAKAQLARVAEQATAGFSERERATFMSLLHRVVANLDSTAG
ncbi:MarR family transcriptional regulator [Corallococcus sp. AB049A]|uniref:MarR family transcriptional regulator n=1 Tax=Corallococcus interemptor TaxID=2316720 RepID=A0A3A8QTD4_9BACT|nr:MULTISPECIES: MarR family transcriptional regulator [Corallococcus]RKH53008.1 MarR family transcriptional regulator [Corallococcus sp. AB050B]RKH71973.1 MarR family transcriptional regulator [Corallococcus interemptor]RKI63477.1 MarR family transcriptional regulator [Corallococcus sp. AB049A]